MNKYQEALNLLCKKCREDAIANGHIGGCAFRDLDNSHCDEYETLQELIDKATPKKPIKRYYTTAYGNTGRIKRLDILCPCCNSKFINGTRTSAGIFEAKKREFINTINNQEYCMFCSQKLDWSDEDG